jgi:hypothetical protein
MCLRPEAPGLAGPSALSTILCLRQEWLWKPDVGVPMAGLGTESICKLPTDAAAAAQMQTPIQTLHVAIMQRLTQPHYQQQTTNRQLLQIILRILVLRAVGASILHHWAPSLRRIVSAVFSRCRGMRRATCNVQCTNSTATNGGITPQSATYQPPVLLVVPEAFPSS